VADNLLLDKLDRQAKILLGYREQIRSLEKDREYLIARVAHLQDELIMRREGWAKEEYREPDSV